MRLLQNADPAQCYTVCRVLQETHCGWEAEILVSLLDDRRKLEEAYIGEAGKEFQPQVRVCDFAALMICAHCPDLKFALKGSYADLDQQIQRMKQQLAAAPSQK